MGDKESIQIDIEQEEFVEVNHRDLILEGILNYPKEEEQVKIDDSKGKGIVVFAHGSGSSGRKSPRNQYVASVLNNSGIGTLLVDLLTSEEQKIDERTKEYRFNIELLANRLVAVTDWML
jgi:putative phosphoribosyl transferase